MKTLFWIGAAFAVGGLLSGYAGVNGQASAAKPPQKPDPLQHMGVVGQGIYFSVPDPKHPTQMLWKAWVKSGGGDFGSGDFSGQAMTALLFNTGKLDAKMTAPLGQGNTQTNTVIASGGARYTSLAPGQRGTYMTAQTVTWNAKTKRGIARGNVHYYSGKSGMTADTPILYFNSGLRLASSKPLSKGQ